MKKTANQANTTKTTSVKGGAISKENDQLKQRKEQATKFENYIHETGLAMGFQLIFAELISKKISPDNYFSYVTIRLKEIGKELDSLKTIPPEPEQEEKNDDEENAQNEDDED